MNGIEKLLLRDSRVEEHLTIREMEQGEASDFIIPYALQTHREEFRKPTILYKSICQGKEIVGFLILVLDPDGSSVELRRIVVSRQGHGIGKRAIEMLRDFCRNDLGRERIWLDLFETNDRARHVYESCGFRRFGSTEHEGRTQLLFEMTG